MKRIGLIGAVLAAVVFSTAALAFDAYFSDAAGNKLGSVWEGQQVYIAVKDPEKGACGISEFQADITIFDFKTGAYLIAESVTFRELGGIGSGLFFWVTQPGSSSKVSVQIGSRYNYTVIPEGMTHVMGTVTPFSVPAGAFSTGGWVEGGWEYVDSDVLNGAGAGPAGAAPAPTTITALPQTRNVERTFFTGTGLLPVFTPGSTNWPADLQLILGRFENNDTVILILRDRTDERNIDQDQVKIVDTVSKLTVTPTKVAYGCGPSCQNIIVRIEDPDENLNCNEIDYVPFFVIINPGSFNPTADSPATNFCSLMTTGGVLFDPDSLPGGVVGAVYEPIRWYNIYEPGRGINYGNAAWWNPNWSSLDGTGLLRAVFFAPETSVNSGVFEFNFGNLEDLQEALGLARTDRLTAGTTIAFYYIDPNDFDDMDLAVIRVGNEKYSEVFITDANGVPVSEVKLGWGGLYIRVYDAGANVEACCQDKVVVHICDPHNEDDSEYYVIDEISNNSGIFFTQNGIPLLPVWDAVSGYQLVFDDWKVQAFNEDTIFVRYNSVDYYPEFLNLLGDANPNAGGGFPPAIMDGQPYVNLAGDTLTSIIPTLTAPRTAARNTYWDVSFAKVKVYDFQVFDGTKVNMRFLDGNYQPVTEIPVSGSLYLEVTDLDQNENPLLREMIFGGWNKDSDMSLNDSAPVWPEAGDTYGLLTLFAGTYPATDPFRPGARVLNPTSITGIPETVKIFMFNLQRGTWERIDLRETQVGSGVFRSTTCVLVTDSRNPGDGNLGSKRGDTIMAFYQDPSNHSDISIISIKVVAGTVTPPTVALSVAFDRSTYYPGDTVTITVTDEQYAGAAEIVGTNVLVLMDKDGETIASWNRLEAVAGQPGKFRVTYTLPETVKLGTITAKYTDPYMTTRTVSATATVVAKALANVTGITVSPNPFKTSTTFTIQAEPAGAVAARITITIYDLTGAKVAELSRENTASVTWNGGNLRNGAYIYVAVVEGAGRAWTFKGFVYIER